MLRESSTATGSKFDLKAIIGANNDNSGVRHGAILLELAEAVFQRDETRMSDARCDVRRNLSDAAFVDTCATIASFNAVVKLADATGIPLEDYKEENTRDIRAQLLIDDFR